MICSELERLTSIWTSALHETDRIRQRSGPLPRSERAYLDLLSTAEQNERSAEFMRNQHLTSCAECIANKEKPTAIAGIH